VKTSVLVVDDDATFRGLAARMLERMGLSVVGEADTVESASAAARALRADAALVDVGLPDGSGIALAIELAELPWSPRIVLTSTDPDAVTEELLRSCGAAAFIPKEDLPGSALRVLLSAGTE
jgi:DNA-binding NarL/FixJ family response regulator